MCGKGVGKRLKYRKTNYVLYCHLAIFGLILAMFLTSQSYDFDVTTYPEARLGVECLLKFIKILWTAVFECISSRNFFRLLKTLTVIHVI